LRGGGSPFRGLGGSAKGKYKHMLQIKTPKSYELTAKTAATHIAKPKKKQRAIDLLIPSIINENFSYIYKNFMYE
jgi:DNA-binding ferritin-like protein